MNINYSEQVGLLYWYLINFYKEGGFCPYVRFYSNYKNMNKYYGNLHKHIY
jgi:hypothetical protein